MAGKAYRYMHNANTMGHAEAYRLVPPFESKRWDYETDEIEPVYHRLVVVSAVDHSYAHETLVFPSDRHGQIADWSEIYGIRGTTDHAEVLGEMGYEIADDPQVIQG